MKTQVMELATDGKIVNQGFMQAVNMTEGTCILKFNYAPRDKSSPKVSTFFVYFNGREVAKYRPAARGIKT